MKKVVVISGAGISAESGLKTFRGSDGLWEGHDIMEVASPEGWAKNPATVLRFYNQRRQQLKEVAPNAAHHALKELEGKYQVEIITQNVDNLHERANSSNILHLHGQLDKVRGVDYPLDIYHEEGDINLGDKCPKGSQLRPHIVWFGEAVPMMDKATEIIADAHIVIIVGTSLQVYPAAGLIQFAPSHASIIYIDPHPTINWELSMRKNVRLIEDTASNAMPDLVKELLTDNSNHAV